MSTQHRCPCGLPYDAVGAHREPCLDRQIVDYLSSLTWDGRGRVDGWLPRYLGVTRTAWTSFASRAFLIAAVARVRAVQTGIPLAVDSFLILVGPQDTGKTQALRALFGHDWFSSSPHLVPGAWCPGAWCQEVTGLEHADTAALHAYASGKYSFAPPPAEPVHHTVFVGTATAVMRTDDGVTDSYRRLWLVSCGTTFKLEKLARDRDQLWAEADMLYRAGAKWWIEPGGLP